MAFLRLLDLFLFRSNCIISGWNQFETFNFPEFMTSDKGAFILLCRIFSVDRPIKFDSKGDASCVTTFSIQTEYVVQIFYVDLLKRIRQSKIDSTLHWWIG